jgi:AI-2 transport protein TqsA
VVFGLKYSSDVLAPIFLAATLAILFTPMLRWLEKKGLPTGLALLVMVLTLGGFIILLIIILTASLQQLSVLLPYYHRFHSLWVGNSVGDPRHRHRPQRSHG